MVIDWMNTAVTVVVFRTSSHDIVPIEDNDAPKEEPKAYDLV